MKEKLNEQISALVDDELAEAEQALLVKRLADDASLRSRLSRYQLISDSLQNHLPRKIDPDFHIGVQLALQDVPALEQATSARLARLFKPVASLAVAASVAVVAVLLLMNGHRLMSPPCLPVTRRMFPPRPIILISTWSIIMNSQSTAACRACCRMCVLSVMTSSVDDKEP